MSGSTSLPLEHIAKVKSVDLLVVLYVMQFAVAALNVCIADSLIGPSSHPYRPFGSNFARIIATFFA